MVRVWNTEWYKSLSVCVWESELPYYPPVNVHQIFSSSSFLQISLLTDQRPHTVQNDSQPGFHEIPAKSVSQMVFCCLLTLRVTQRSNARARGSSANINISPRVPIILIKGIKWDGTAGEQLEIHHHVPRATMQLHCKVCSLLSSSPATTMNNLEQEAK